MFRFHMISFTLLFLVRCTGAIVMTKAQQRNSAIASGIVEPLIQCNTIGTPDKICVFQKGSLCYKHSEGQFFVPDDVLPAGVEDYTSLLDPTHYLNYLQYTKARAVCVADQEHQTLFLNEKFTRECERTFIIHSRLPPKKAAFDTARPKKFKKGAVLFGHSDYNTGWFFHDLLDNVLSDFATVKEAEYMLNERIASIRIASGTQTSIAQRLYKTWGAESSDEEHTTEDTCFETAIVGKMPTHHKEYLLSRSEDPHFDFVGDGWASQYYMKPQVLRAYRDAVVAGLTAPGKQMFECSKSGSPKLLYIKRGAGATEKRMVTNEVQILNAIHHSPNKWCVKQVELESYPLDEQVQMWHDADVAIATHGASGASAVFMRPGTFFVELQGNNWDRRWALDIATLSGVNTMVLRSQTSKIPPRGSEGWTLPAKDYDSFRDQNVEVDVTSFQDLLVHVGHQLKRST